MASSVVPSSVSPIRTSKIAKPNATAKAAPSVFTLRVELTESVPPIWRQIEIDSRATLEVLHHVLQAAMGRTDSHLHEFETEAALMQRRPRVTS